MFVSVALALVAAAAQPAATVPAQASEPAAKPKRVCHVEDAVIGSLTPKRVCVTVPATAPTKPDQPTADKQPASTPQSGAGN